MASAPEFRRITRDQLPDKDFDGIEPFLQAYNTLAEQTVNALTSNLTVGANILGEIIKVVINTPTGYTPVVFNTTRIPWSFTANPPRVVLVGNCFPAPLAAPFISWSYTYGVITIGYVTGLASATSYEITLLVL